MDLIDFYRTSIHEPLSSHQVWNFNSTGRSSGQNDSNTLVAPKAIPNLET